MALGSKLCTCKITSDANVNKKQDLGYFVVCCTAENLNYYIKFVGFVFSEGFHATQLLFCPCQGKSEY